MRAEATFSRYESWPATPVHTAKMLPLLAGYREDNPFKRNDVDTHQGQGDV